MANWQIICLLIFWYVLLGSFRPSSGNLYRVLVYICQPDYKLQGFRLVGRPCFGGVVVRAPGCHPWGPRSIPVLFVSTFSLFSTFQIHELGENESIIPLHASRGIMDSWAGEKRFFFPHGALHSVAWAMGKCKIKWFWDDWDPLQKIWFFHLFIRNPEIAENRKFSKWIFGF